MPDPVCACGKTSEGICPRCGQQPLLDSLYSLIRQAIPNMRKAAEEINHAAIGSLLRIHADTFEGYLPETLEEWRKNE
jgi:hypothetical protein